MLQINVEIHSVVMSRFWKGPCSLDKIVLSSCSQSWSQSSGHGDQHDIIHLAGTHPSLIPLYHTERSDIQDLNI